eukprot:RCo004386
MERFSEDHLSSSPRVESSGSCGNSSTRATPEQTPAKRGVHVKFPELTTKGSGLVQRRGTQFSAASATPDDLSDDAGEPSQDMGSSFTFSAIGSTDLESPLSERKRRILERIVLEEQEEAARGALIAEALCSSHWATCLQTKSLLIRKQIVGEECEDARRILLQSSQKRRKRRPSPRARGGAKRCPSDEVKNLASEFGKRANLPVTEDYLSAVQQWFDALSEPQREALCTAQHPLWPSLPFAPHPASFLIPMDHPAILTSSASPPVSPRAGTQPSALAATDPPSSKVPHPPQKRPPHAAVRPNPPKLSGELSPSAKGKGGGPHTSLSYLSAWIHRKGAAKADKEPSQPCGVGAAPTKPKSGDRSLPQQTKARPATQEVPRAVPLYAPLPQKKQSSSPKTGLSPKAPGRGAAHGAPAAPQASPAARARGAAGRPL